MEEIKMKKRIQDSYDFIMDLIYGSRPHHWTEVAKKTRKCSNRHKDVGDGLKEPSYFVSPEDGNFPSKSSIAFLSNLAYTERKYTKNSKQIFSEMKLRGLSPNTCIQVSVSYSYFPTIGLPVLLQENRWTDPGNM